MGKRAKLPKAAETAVLTRSARRCCICFALHGDDAVKAGQIAHLDDDRSNNDLDNLAWLCLDHHGQWHTRANVTKGFKPDEVKAYRAQLYRAVEEGALRDDHEPQPHIVKPPPTSRTTTGDRSTVMNAAGNGNIQVGNVRGDLNIQTAKRPVFRFLPARGTVGDNDLLRKRISELFNRLGEEREKRFGKSAYGVMYSNFKRDFGIENDRWTVVWGWPETGAQPVIDYLSDKYANTIAGRKDRAAKKAGQLPRRPQLYKQERELLSQLGLQMSSPEVEEALLRYFGVHSHTELSHHDHWLWVCRLQREVREIIGEENPEQEDEGGRS
jgi:hypothetical protein